MAIVVLLAGKLSCSKLLPRQEYDPHDRDDADVPGVGQPHLLADRRLILFGSFIGYLYYLYVDERKHYDPLDHGFDENGAAPAGVPRTPREAWVAAGVAVVAMAVTVGSAMLTLSITEIIVARTDRRVADRRAHAGRPRHYLGFITAVSGIRKGDAGIPLGTLSAARPTHWSPSAAARSSRSSGAETTGALGSAMGGDLRALLWAYLWSRNRGTVGKKGAIYLIAMYFAYVTLRSVFFAVDQGEALSERESRVQ